jgi:hypothetical protein
VRRKLLVSVVLFVLAGLVAGCGQRTLPQSQTYPVKGRILLQGQPASFVLVRFAPVGNAGMEAIGRTDKDGYFELRTGNEGHDGAVPGQYTVTIEDYDPIQNGPLPGGATATKVPEGTKKARETYEVRAATDNNLTIEVS